MTTTAAPPTVEKTGLVRRYPVTAFAVGAIAPTWAIQFAFLARGWDLFPAMLLEMVFLLGSAVLVTAHTRGRAGVRRLFSGAVRWRMGTARFAVVLLALPVLTLLIAAVSGSIRAPDGGVGKEVLAYLFLTLVFGAVLGNVWEETAWAGFAQRRLMDRHGLLAGSLLTAIPFALIHLPLAFADHGLHGTSGRDLAITWTVLILTAPFFRYLLGTVLIDTGGSVLAVAILHASFNASGQITAVHGWWPSYAALIVLLALTVVWRGRTRPQARLEERG
jgi:membrane protease YdiL (CAAX protease family)